MTNPITEGALKADTILRGLTVLAEIRRKWPMEGAGRQPFDAHQFEFVLQCTKDLHNDLESSGLTIAAIHAKGLVDAFEMSTDQIDGNRVIEGKSYSYATHHLERLIGVIAEEAGTKKFLSLSHSSAALYESTSPIMGSDVDSAFVESMYDINEAGKCLALERYTAAVFHLMHAMETGVKVLGTKLGATVLNSNGEVLPWGVIVANIKPEIDKLPKGQDQDEWYKLHALLHSVNRAFRTKTAHPAANTNRPRQ